MQETIGADDWLVVLAVGTTTSFESPQPLVQAIGTTTFTLVDVTVTDASNLTQGDRLSVAPGDRGCKIERRLTYHELAPAVQEILAPLITRIIRRNEQRFIETFNTPRVAARTTHPLALLPGLSVDCQRAIIAERSQRRFTDFADLTARVECCEQPCTVVAERVLLELRGGTTPYRWLTA